MTTEPYVPTVEVVRDAVAFPRERLGEPRPISREAFDRFVAKIRAEAWDEGVKAVRDWWETPDDEKYVIFNPYGTHPADRLLDDINANGDDDD